MCARRQAEILHSGAQLLKPDGRLVYSTCTFAPEENEGAIFRFLSTHPDFTLEPITVDWGCSAFAAERIQPFCPEVDNTFDLTMCRRIFPQHGGEGHFIALLKRSTDALYVVPSTYIYPTKDAHRQAAEELYHDCFTDTPNGIFCTIGEQVRILPKCLPDCNGLGVISAGVAVAAVCKNRLEPTHSIFVASHGSDCGQHIDLSPADPRLIAYLHGEEITCDGLCGWTAVCVCGVPVGFGKASNGKLKNRYPKGLRLL